jgi:mannosyl-oligosaccharide alpha-1,2-mannosidase
MMPVRRFRFLALAVFVTIALFLFTRTTSKYDSYKSYAEQKYENAIGGSVLRPEGEQTKEHAQAANGPHEEENMLAPNTPKTEARLPATTSAVVVGFVSEVAPGSQTVVSTATLAPTQALPIEYQPVIAPEVPIELGQGRVELDDIPPLNNDIHWSKQPEHFPITSTIQLPTNKPTAIPRVQHKFKSSSNKGADKDRLAVIKAAVEHAWNGYQEKAWGHDEVKLYGSWD